MAESFAQRRNAVNQALRRLRAAYRKTDSAGEMLERELDRLIARKTIVSPASIKSVQVKLEVYVKFLNAIEQPLMDAIRLATNYA
jgi:multidrug efflux pump subunit AcrA (membrane-fusion protein)